MKAMGTQITGRLWFQGSHDGRFAPFSVILPTRRRPQLAPIDKHGGARSVRFKAAIAESGRLIKRRAVTQT